MGVMYTGECESAVLTKLTPVSITPFASFRSCHDNGSESTISDLVRRYCPAVIVIKGPESGQLGNQCGRAGLLGDTVRRYI
jgi:hypothetical protein